MDSPHVTTGKLAVEIGQPIWRVRRAVDALGVQLPRAGQYRVIPRSLIPRIVEAIRQRYSDAATLTAETAQCSA